MARAVGHLVFALVFLTSVAGCGDDDPVRPRDGGPPGDGGIPFRDEDGDGISDTDEGRAENRDTDGDGIPDYLDADSDGDGYPDSEEGTRDLDGDGRGNWIDTDADGNGILDADEVPGDVDGDGDPNYRDLDDDGDNLADTRELRGMTSPPADSDGDGTPDYQDPDSDNDTILDGHELDVDTDGDGFPDFLDVDSDNDGLPDLREAGDDDLFTPPVDTDGDGIPDFRDPDSDGDGLSDSDEVNIHGTSPTDADSDRDGVSDLIEIGAGTDPQNDMDSPRTRGDFVFTVPYMAPPDPPRDTLSFSTSIKFADVYFLFDISGSMAGEITALRNAVTTIIGDLTCADSGTACMDDTACGGGQICSPFSMTCIEDPDVARCVPSMWTGTGYYEVTLENALSLQPNPAATSAAIRTSTYGGTERLYAAVEATASGSSPGFTANGCTGPSPGRIGCPAFRSEAVRILVAFTDEGSFGGTLAGAANALMTNDITLIGVNSGSTGSRNALRDLANASGSLDRSGNPLVYDGADAAVVPVVTTAITEIVEGVPLRVTIDATDEPDDAGDALQFIQRLETNTTAAECAMIATEDTDSDGAPDAFPAVTPGTRVCWDVIPRQNDSVEPTLVPQVFRARLTVYGDGSPLDSRLVYFLIPPRPPVVEGPS